MSGLAGPRTGKYSTRVGRSTLKEFHAFLRSSRRSRWPARACLPRSPTDPFPAPINATDVVKVNYVEFATLPDLGGPMPARPMLLVDEPGTRRLFVNDMRGPLYTIPREGKTVTRISRYQRREVWA